MVPYSLDDLVRTRLPGDASPFPDISAHLNARQTSTADGNRRRKDIIAFLDEPLDAAYDDYRPNGRQVPGRSEIQTVVRRVSANFELFATETNGVLAPREPLAERLGCATSSSTCPIRI
jgi:hypothetical protein